MDAFAAARASSYVSRKEELEEYFDRTAASAWEALTSDAPVSRIRATVRAGREAMREAIFSHLPDLSNASLLDAGCGTGALANAAAARGAAVTAIDLSPTLIGIAKERYPAALPDDHAAVHGRVAFRAGDMLTVPGRFTHLVAMDSLIHYRAADIVAVLSALAAQVEARLVFTVAPRTPALSAMHTVGKLFPRHDRAPAIAPVAIAKLKAALQRAPALSNFRLVATQRISAGFYTSEAIVMERTG